MHRAYESFEVAPAFDTRRRHPQLRFLTLLSFPARYRRVGKFGGSAVLSTCRL